MLATRNQNPSLSPDLKKGLAQIKQLIKEVDPAAIYSGYNKRGKINFLQVTSGHFTVSTKSSSTDGFSLELRHHSDHKRPQKVIEAGGYMDRSSSVARGIFKRLKTAHTKAVKVAQSKCKALLSEIPEMIETDKIKSSDFKLSHETGASPENKVVTIVTDSGYKALISFGSKQIIRGKNSEFTSNEDTLTVNLKKGGVRVGQSMSGPKVSAIRESLFGHQSPIGSLKAGVEK